jgi:MFS superfamily sulfate permease-like transporter
MSVQTTTAMSLLVANVALVQSSTRSMRHLFTLAVLTGLIKPVLGLLRLG